MKINILDDLPAHPDELSLCDEDVRKVFERKTYIVGLPTQAQLVKELRLLRIEMERTREEIINNKVK